MINEHNWRLWAIGFLVLLSTGIWRCTRAFGPCPPQDLDPQPVLLVVQPHSTGDGMDKTRQPCMGYAQRCAKKSWRTTKDDSWEIMMLDQRDGPFTLVGLREIGGTMHTVWRGGGSKYYAQVYYGD